MDEGDPLAFAESAYEHGLPASDIAHAYEHPMRSFAPDDEGLIMIVGGDFAGRLLEVGYITSDDGFIVIVHAQPARAKYLRNW